MQVVVLLLLVVSLALLVSGLITGGTPLAIASLATSLLAVYAISRYRGRQPGDRAPRGRAGGAVPAVPAGAAVPVGAVPVGTAVPVGAVPAGAVPVGAPAASRAAHRAPAVPEPEPGGSDSVRRVPADAAAEPVGKHSQPEPDGDNPSMAETDPPVAEADPPPDGDDPPVVQTDPPLRSRGDEPVWVIDGRPRYHLDDCGFLAGRDPEPVPLRQAVEDGFTPCALCDPDSGLVARASRS